MLNRLICWLYARLGVRYWLVVLLGQVGAAVTVVLVTIAVIASYFREPVAQVAVLAVVAAVFGTDAPAPSTVHSVLILNATDGPEFAAAWDGVRSW